jgi:septal ring factor EnvC (AmiA/AmiB activator)
MKVNLKKIILTIIILTIVVKGLYSQTKEELENKKTKTEENLKISNQLLQQTEKTKTAGLNKLLIIKKRISLREQLINEINDQIKFLDSEITRRNNDIIKLENELKLLKDEYARMIYFAYKNRNSYDRLIFILAAEDFNQAYRRMKYFQQYTQYRKKQAEKIVISQKNLEYENEQLKEQKSEKIQLLANKEKEKSLLNSERFVETNEINRLKKKESQIRKEIKDNQEIMKRLDNAIEELIAKEAKAKKALSTNEEELSIEFRSAKGKLKWPVKNGLVIQEFGEHPHPILKGVKIKNDGIEISTTKDEKVTSIYEGEVTKVIAIPGANMAVIIRHGHYLSLYSNIVNVRVKSGDRIPEGYYIGDVYFSNKSENNTLHLGIYEERNVLDPKLWLIKQ